MLEWLERIVFAVVLVVGVVTAVRRRRRGAGVSTAAVSWPAVREAALGRTGAARCLAFWVCLVLALNVVRVWARQLVPGLGPAPTTGLAGGMFLLLKDLSQGAAIIVACMAARRAWRRRIVELMPAASPSLLLWVGILAASGLVHEAGALAAHRGDAGYQAEAAWQPLTIRLALLMLYGLGPMIPSVVGYAAWWLHAVAALVIANRVEGGVPDMSPLPIGQD